MSDIITRNPLPFGARFHAWRENQSLTMMLGLCLGWAVLMGLLAQVRVPLWFTPVPFTMQVFGILLGGVILGTRFGALAQAIYVGVGILGVPWFQGYDGGWAYFLGPTGGYLLAAPFAAALTGAIVGLPRLRPAVRSALAMFAGIAVIYILGMAWLAVVLDVSLPRAFVLGVAPFMLLDALKAVAAAVLGRPFVYAR